VLATDRPEGDSHQIDETASARCTPAWLADHNKKSSLASVGVGTIDPACSRYCTRAFSRCGVGLFRQVLTEPGATRSAI
jgi:hypothetical protein